MNALLFLIFKKMSYNAWMLMVWTMFSTFDMYEISLHWTVRSLRVGQGHDKTKNLFSIINIGCM